MFARTPQRKGEYKVGLLDGLLYDIHNAITDKQIRNLQQQVNEMKSQQEQASIDSKMYKYIYIPKKVLLFNRKRKEH